MLKSLHICKIEKNKKSSSTVFVRYSEILKSKQFMIYLMLK